MGQCKYFNCLDRPAVSHPEPRFPHIGWVFIESLLDSWSCDNSQGQENKTQIPDSPAPSPGAPTKRVCSGEKEDEGAVESEK